jgi:aspartyl-tRNA(Asn)/glutamyl-tRNA(Gln) amidotransferase subunit B
VTYELVVGLEIHAQLVTETKAFCRCANRYGDPPNTLTCPTCLGMPGALPVLNRNVVVQAAKLAMALSATLHPRSKFDRKNYFYPDLPKGYQISQFDEPFSTGGYLDIDVHGQSKRIRITRAHIEEDAGKSMHLADGSTVIDMNRCGVPLVEIVTEPDFRTPAEAAAFVATIRDLLRYIDVCDGNMERGSMRCDVNISVMPAGQSALNERTEIKNLNSVRAVERAIHVERERQIAIYNTGGSVHRETLLWDETTEEIRPMRRKEGSDDYRYFPEPDLVELKISQEFLREIRAMLPEMPWERRARFRDSFMLHEEAVSLLISEKIIGDYFEQLIKLGIEPKAAANWIQGEARRWLADRDWQFEQFPLPAEALAELQKCVDNGTISLTTAKDVFRKMLADGRSARQIIRDDSLAQTGDAAELQAVLRDVLDRFPAEIVKFKAGKKNVVGFLMGEAMKASGGKANPQILSKLLQEMLNS